jgi:hypothetical protein
MHWSSGLFGVDAVLCVFLFFVQAYISPAATPDHLIMSTCISSASWLLSCWDLPSAGLAYYPGGATLSLPPLWYRAPEILLGALERAISYYFFGGIKLEPHA